MDNRRNACAALRGWIKGFVGGLAVLGSAAVGLAQDTLPRVQPQEQLPPPAMAPAAPAQPVWTAPAWTPSFVPAQNGSFWDTIRDSVCGRRCGLEWTPLCGILDGFCDPWV